MRFWDSSAIVPLVVEEEGSRACRDALRSDSVQLVWWLTRTEVKSALWRKRREHALSAEEVQRAERRLEKLAARWNEIEPIVEVRETAEHLLRRHSLRAADSLQLAAALVVVGFRPRNRPFVTLDETLATAAVAEGFEVAQPGREYEE